MCRRCGGRLRVIASIEDPPVIARILKHLGGDAEPVDSYADHAVRFGTGYRYRVGAVYTDHATGFATGVEATTPSANPATVTASLDGHGGVNVSWSPMPGAAGYTLAGDGLQAPRTDTSTQYHIVRIAGGDRSWTVVADYDTASGRVADTEMK